MFLVITKNSVLAFGESKKVKALEEKISSFNLELSCKNTDDCIALPAGHKACGGPDRYIVTSKKNSKLAYLKKAIDEHLVADREWQQKQNGGSACNVEQAPPMLCQHQKCVQVVPSKRFGF